MWEECQAGGQQVQAPDAAVLLARLRKACQCVRRGERTRESHQGFFTTLQTTLCFKVTLCCLDVIKGKIGIL